MRWIAWLRSRLRARSAVWWLMIGGRGGGFAPRVRWSVRVRCIRRGQRRRRLEECLGLGLGIYTPYGLWALHFAWFGY
jgi:hypothetical protein